MSKYNVEVVIKFNMEIEASSNSKAIEIAQANFDVEDFIDEINENIKFNKAVLKEIESEEDEYTESYSTEDEEDEDEYED